MYLSQLVFLSVKNVKYLDDIDFNINDFRLGTYNEDLDYKNSINNVFTPLNEAIHRLSDRNKILNKTTYLGDGKATIPYAVPKDVKNIVSIFVMLENGNYVRLSFRQMGKDLVNVFNQDYIGYPLWIEYQQDIPFFSEVDFDYKNGNSVDVDLKDYGITNTSCSYIIEYVQGKLLETIAPEMANMHTTRAEQYFDDLEDQQTSYNQQQVYTTYRIGE